VSRYEKGKTRNVKPIWTVSGSGISWAMCKSAPRPKQMTMPASHHSVFTGRMPYLLPNQQHQSIEGTFMILLCIIYSFFSYSTAFVMVKHT